VLVVEDENGEIVRETMRDSDSINLYKSMRECLVYLTNLDPLGTQQQMLGKLSLQVDGSGKRFLLREFIVLYVQIY
jgi:exportin-1